MVVDNDPPGLPSAGSNAAQRLPNEDGQRFKGDPRTLPMIKLSELSDAHRRQVVTGLRDLVQRTCPETVQHLVEKRKKISDVIDVVKQQTNLTFFNLSSTACNEQVVGNNRVGLSARSTNGVTGDRGSVAAVAPGVKNAANSRSPISAARQGINKQQIAPSSMSAPKSTSTLPKITPPVLSVSTNILSRNSEASRVNEQSIMQSINTSYTTESTTNLNSNSAKKRVKLDPNISTSPLPTSPLIHQFETPPPQLFRAPTTSTVALGNSSPTDLSLQQYCRSGISYTRLRTTSGNRSRRGGRSQQRWKSGTIVTHYLALSSQDLVDYPDRPPLSDNDVDTIRNESIARMSMSDGGDMSEDDDGDARSMLHATSQSPNGTCASNSFVLSSGASNVSMDSRARSSSPPPVLLKSSAQATISAKADGSTHQQHSTEADLSSAVDVQPEPLSPETAAALHADLPTDSMLLRMLERRYSLTLSDAARRLLDADDEAEVARSKYRYPAAILKFPEGSALVHCRTMRLVKQFFPGFNVTSKLGKCELCKEVGLRELWSKSGRFCSSQCTKRFSRHCQTQQNRQQQEAIERRVLSSKNASSSTSNTTTNLTSVTSKSNSRYANKTHAPLSSKHIVEKSSPVEQQPPVSDQSRKSSSTAAHSSQPRQPVAAPVTNAMHPTTSHSARMPKRNEQPPTPAAAASAVRTAPVAAAAPAGPPPFPVDPVVLMSLEHKNAKQWTTEEVAQFIAGSFVVPICPDIPRLFISGGVDGEALLILNFELLMSCMKIPVGPAMKINKAIELLHASNGKVDVRNLPQLPAHMKEPART